MAATGTLWWTKTCEEGIDLRSTCDQRSIIDAINSVFLVIFHTFLVIQFTKRGSAGKKRRGWLIAVISVCCVFTSTGYFFIAFLENGGISDMRWWSSVIRGIVWASLAVSVILELSKAIRFFVSAWWAFFFFLSSALNIEALIRTHRIDIIELVSWAMNLLLFASAILNLRCYEDDLDKEKSFSEPLLVEEDEEPVTALCRVGFFSRLTFSWIHPLLALGYSKPLALEDVPSLAPEDEASVAYRRFADSWELIRTEKAFQSSGSLTIQALVKVHYGEMIFEAICAFLRTISVSSSPLLLHYFVNYANTAEKNWHHGFMLVACLVLLKIVESLSQRHLFFSSRRSGMRMRSSLMIAVYQKQLKLSNGGRNRHSTGEIVNYIAVDAYRMGEFLWWFHLTWSLVLQLFLCVGVLFLIVGIGAITGLVPLLVCGLLNLPFAKIIKDCQIKFMEAQDERLRATSEILNNMKVIKLQSWEDRFKNLVESLRQNEFRWLEKAQYVKACGTLLYWLSPTIVSSVIFFGCLLFNSTPLNASTIFAVLAALRTMGEPVRFIPEALSIMIQAMVSFDRLNAFLLDDEIHNEGIRRSPLYHVDSVIAITGGYFSWDPIPSTPTLKDVDLQVIRGQKIAICGAVGAGKSSLLHAILGEIPKLSGKVVLVGSFAYVSQAAWIQSGTIRDNVLFGKMMDETKYAEVIRASALDKDILNFKHGDLTEIGQRGLNMSGGQKQRIQLARAVYSNADIYLLDDPFSAVDAHTAATLFHDCILSALEDKTVILVTHQVEFLSEVDKILVMEGGEVTQSGTYEDLLMAGEAFKSLVNAHKDVITVCNYSNDFFPHRSGEINVEWVKMPSGSKYEIEDKEILGVASQVVQLTEGEEREMGDVGWKSFLDYVLTFNGFHILCLSLSSSLCFILLQAAASYWLALATGIKGIRTVTLIGVYSAISTLSACFVYLRSFFAAKMGLKGSSTFFSAFNNAVFSAPMLFFDSTPVGRILTRASSDLSLVDFDIPFFLMFVLATSMELGATLLVMASVTWQILFVAIITMILSKFLQDYYLASAKQLIRINGTAKAPVMNYATETSLGVATIRAFNMMDRFSKNNVKLVNTDAKLFFHSNAAMEWLVLRVEALQNLTLFVTSLLLMLLPPKSSSPGLVGLSLSYALVLSTNQVFVVRTFCNLSNCIVSAERIKQFMSLPSEPPAIVEHYRPPSSWPSVGRIELHDLKVRYRSNAPLVLKGITCTFKEGTRVGVVGRTGSGKTTMITSLFRLVEPHSGTISIDGIDISSIGLKDLRMKLSIIPQEPTLFRGSVRTNLDPLGLFTDDEIWKALEKCRLKKTICSLPHLLDSMVTDEGENWSAGQQQLFGLGRVLLRRNRILVLDEATASIDSATDAMLQRIIREEFHGCTVITVAHRVPTVIDSNMVMVLSYGELVEYDEPSNLMQVDSAFSNLVAEYWASCHRRLRN